MFYVMVGKNRLVSSANIIGVNIFDALLRSLTLTQRKNIGPNMDPCGTQYKLYLPYRFVVHRIMYCFLLDK